MKKILILLLLSACSRVTIDKYSLVGGLGILIILAVLTLLYLFIYEFPGIVKKHLKKKGEGK